MNILLSLLILPACVLFSCAQQSDHAQAFLNIGPIEGIYEGYRSQYTDLQPVSDSTRIELKVTQRASGKLEILQIVPNEFKYVVNLENGKFTYDLGLGEAACGVTHISGQGYFQDNRLYLREKSECINAKSAGAHFIQLRAQKK